MDHSKIEGAYLLLKRFKNRLKLFDDALGKMSDTKVEKKEFHQLEKQLEKNKASAIYDEMQALFHQNT